MRRVLWALTIGAVAAGGVLWALAGREAAPRGVALIGDHAPVLARALGLSAPAPEPAVTVATVIDWTQVNFLQGLGVRCVGRCEGEGWLVRVLEPRPGGSRKTVFVRLAPFGDGNDWPPVPPCLRAVLAAEMVSLRPAVLPECADDLPPPVQVTLLPWGLGAF